MVEWLAHTEFRVIRNLRHSEGFECDGLSAWFPEERKAWISVRQGMSDEASEKTCLHEVLHLQFEGHAHPNGDYSEGYELGLNRTAEALWEAWHPTP